VLWFDTSAEQPFFAVPVYLQAPVPMLKPNHLFYPGKRQSVTIHNIIVIPQLPVIAPQSAPGIIQIDLLLKKTNVH
jgi:hypothetical protein